MKKAKSNPDSNPLRVLLLEDNPADAELVEREMQQAGIIFTFRLVEGKREFVKALAEFRPQVILSDFKLPKFDGIAALEAARLKAPDTPFIFVSGSIGEEKAIETLALGASDYVFKDNLARLGPAVKRVVAEAQLRLEKKKTDEELHRHVEELRLMAEAADRFVQINNLDEVYDYLAQTISEISGADYLMLSLYDEKLQAVRPKIITGFEPFRETIRRRFRIDPMQMVFYLKDMGKDEFNDFVSRRLLPVRDGFYGLSNRKIPRSLSRLIEKLLGIGTMHTMGFSWENKLFGGLTVFFKKGNDLKNSAQIEAMANLAAVSIKRLLAEQALRESETKYRTLVTQSPDGIFIADLQGNFLSVNQAMCNGLGYSEAELLATKIWDIVPKEYNALNKVRLAAILKGKAKNETMEYMVKTKDGETRYVAILSVPFHQDNKLIGFQGIARDITENKKMEIRLRESEEYYRTLVETSPDAIVIIDAGGRVTFASQKTFEIFGFPAQTTIKGISIMDFVEPGEVSSVQARMVEILSGSSLPQVKEYRLQRHDRRLFWGEVSSAPLRDAAGRSIGLLLICRDISERKRIEAERLALQEIMQGLMTGETLNDFLKNVHRSIAKVIYAENFFVALYNKNTALFEEAYSVDKFDTTPFQPSSLEKSVSKYIFRSGKPLLLSQAAFDELEASGEVELVGTNAPSWLGVPLKISRETIGVMVVQDYETKNRYSERDLNFLVSISGQVALVVERKRAETEILREKAFLEALVETAPEGISIHDNLGRMLRVNSEFVRMFGYNFDEVAGKVIDDLVVPPGYQEEANALTKSVGQGEKVVLETVRKRKDGTLFNVSIIGAPIRIAEQQVAVYAIYRDISERKRAEEELRISAEKWQSTFNSITDIVSVISLDHMFLEINKAGCDAMGLKREDIIGKKCYELVHHLHNPLTGCPCSLAIQSKKMEVNEVLENGRYYQLTAWPILDANGELLAFSHTMKDISDRKEAEEAFLREKSFLDQLVESAPEAIVLAENNGQILRVNSEFEKMFGYSAKEAIGRLIDDLVVPPKYRREATDVTQTVAHGEKFSLETVRWRKDGALLHVSLVGSPIIIGGEQVAAYGIYRDISERKQAEEQIRASLKEKEVLLQEIHHRVKNNLQIISGLLTLQAEQSAGKSLAEIFQASQDRIRSIALIHEKLYRSHNLAEIAFDEYLRALTENLFLSHGIAADRITARYDMESILFTIEKAIPLGLIVNELVTNALKHAFPAGRQGEIRIGLHGYEGTKSYALKTNSSTLHCVPTCELIVADNGVGLPAGQIPEQQKSLGMNLVSMLAKQIQAELKVTTGPGTEFRLLFPGLPANKAFKDKEHGG